MTDEMPKMYTPAQAAEVLGVTRRTLYTYVRTKKLPAYRSAARRWYIDEADLMAFMGLNKDESDN